MERYLRVNLWGTGPSSYKKKNLPGRGLTKVEKQWYRGSIDRTVHIHEATAYSIQSDSLDSRLDCTESEWGSKLESAKDYFHTTDPKILLGPMH